MELSLYDVIKSAYRSRLLFRTEAEYRKLVGVSFETIRARRDDEAALSGYYDLLSQECRRQCGESLYAMVTAYVEASAVCRGEVFDWKERRQLASRKKFCRWMFRRVALPGVKLIAAEELKFSPKDCDSELFDEIYPSGYDAGRIYDLIFIMLITYGVVKPCELSAERSRDVTDKDVTGSHVALETLLMQLRDDIPPIGIVERPIIIDIILERLADKDYVPEDYSVAQVWDVLNRIEDACLSMSSPQRNVNSDVEVSGYSMPGIWVDDADEGRSRFWVFPENKLMAFCYQFDSAGTVLKPYEFTFFRRHRGDTDEKYCLIITARGNEQILDSESGMMQPEEFISAYYTLGDKDEYGTFGEISFEPESENTGKWFDWRSFTRLSRSDPRQRRFMQLLKDIYNPSSPESVLFRNAAPFMTDEPDVLIAIDNKYIYVSDLPAPDRVTLRCESEESGLFGYEMLYRDGDPAVSLLALDISPEHPLYLLPRFTDMDRPMSARQRRFAEACRNIHMYSNITIYHTSRHPHGVLCLNDFSLTYHLSDDCEELRRYGAIVITDPHTFFNKKRKPLANH